MCILSLYCGKTDILPIWYVSGQKSAVGDSVGLPQMMRICQSQNPRVFAIKR